MVEKGKKEKGQAIVLIAIAFIGLIAFAALAIDGSMAYADRRDAQNAADASSLAGGGTAALMMENDHIVYSNFDCDHLPAPLSAAQSAAENMAAANGYSSDNVTISFGCNDTAVYESPEKYLDITTSISITLQPALMDFIYKDDFNQTVLASTRVQPRQPLAFGNAVVALNPAACSGHSNGATFHGGGGEPDGTIVVQGSGIFSNGCIRVNGHPVVDASDGGHVYYAGEFEGYPSETNPPAEKVGYTIPPETYELQSEPTAADCSGRWYDDLNGHLSPGLYCITGDLRINAHDEITGDGITIYIPNGELRINGNATVQLTSPGEDPDTPPAIPGVLIYAPASNDNGIQINGNSESYFQGTILAPGADCDMLGNGTMYAYRTQLICWNVEVGGSASTHVFYDETNQHSKPTSLDLQQ